MYFVFSPTFPWRVALPATERRPLSSMRSPAETIDAVLADLEYFRQRPGMFLGRDRVTPETVQAFLNGVMTGLDACGISPPGNLYSKSLEAHGLTSESPHSPLSQMEANGLASDVIVDALLEIYIQVLRRYNGDAG